MNITLRHGNVEIGFTAEDPEEAWSKIGKWQYVFLCAAMCGKCKSTKTYLNRREWDKGERSGVFWEAVCYDCKARLDFWPCKDGRFFEPKLKDKDKNPIPNEGWTIWVPPSFQRGVASAVSHVRASRNAPKHDEDTMHRDGSELDQSEIPFSWLLLLLPALSFLT